MLYYSISYQLLFADNYILAHIGKPYMQILKIQTDLKYDRLSLTHEEWIINFYLVSCCSCIYYAKCTLRKTGLPKLLWKTTIVENTRIFYT